MGIYYDFVGDESAVGFFDLVLDSRGRKQDGCQLLEVRMRGNECNSRDERKLKKKNQCKGNDSFYLDLT